MSFLGKLFGARSVDEERADADRLFASGEFGPARLAYQRAHERARDDAGVAAALDERMRACADGIAAEHLREAELLLADGHVDLAVVEFSNASEVAASASLREDAERRLSDLERRDAREAATVREQSEDERFETLGGHWELAQTQEYAEHGDALRRALLALADGGHAEARVTLERLAAETSTACYLWLELGRARLLDGDATQGRAALETFLARLPEGEGGDARLVAHMELAGVRHFAGDADGALAEYEAALDALPEDPRPYLAMATFLRNQGLAEEALDVLTSARSVVGEASPEWRILQETGLALADLGRDAEAIATLEEVVDHLVSRQHLDLPPEGTLRLAALHEKLGAKGRALDLFHLLTSGSDQAGHLRYHLEAARLMTDLGLDRDARRMLQRALELVGDDSEARAGIEQRLADREG